MPAQSTEHLTHPKYRPDIDGLRAIAILSVVGFHAFPFWIQGGFIGVDIFFVISGYLISTIILGSLERNNFSFVDFYSRRIRRIFPALLLVLIACFALGWFVLLADEYKQLGKHIAGGAGFVSNFLFWHESGYFDSAAESKPLLHLWSLGVEEQFYIIWPLLLWLTWKKLNLLTITVVVALISFALNIANVNGGHAEAAFYSPQTRFWELMAGSILAYLALHKIHVLKKLQLMLYSRIGEYSPANTHEALNITISNMQSMFGVALIAIGVLVITKERNFPGWWALLPTLGALLIISAGAQAWFNRVILSSRVLVWFGLISFPLYLWHWPLLSFARIVESEAPSRELRISIVLISVALAWLTYKIVEHPIRFGQYSRVKTITLVCLMVIIGYVGYNDYKRDGLGFRLNDRQEYSEYFENGFPEWKYYEKTGLVVKNRADCNFFDVVSSLRGHTSWLPRSEIGKSCYERNFAYSNAVFLWGDSHASQLDIGLENNLPSNWQRLIVATSGCPPTVKIEVSTTALCAKTNQFALKAIAETKPDVVVVAQNLGHSIESFNLISEKLKALGVEKVIFTGPTPHWTSDLNKIILTKLWLNTPQRTYKGIDQKILAVNKALQESFVQTVVRPKFRRHLIWCL